MGEKSKPGVGILSGTKVIVGDNELRSFLKEKGFGEEKGKRHEISLIEAIYLVEKEKMRVTDGKKILDFDDLLKNGNKVEENFYAKYSVYSDLRGRGLLVRTGLNHGQHAMHPLATTGLQNQLLIRCLVLAIRVLNFMPQL